MLLPSLRTALLAATSLLAAGGAARATDVVIGPGQCGVARIGDAIAPAQIGEPVSGVTLDAPVWHGASGGEPAYCEVKGAILPVDRSATARPIHFAVGLPARWGRVAIQMGGAGMDGSVPQIAGGAAPGEAGYLPQGIATFASDSGHSSGDTGWALNDEAIKNLAYLQMKKTHDAAFVVIERAYGIKPRYSYWVGNSQGGREGLTVVQRYPADYDGVVVTVPVINFTGLMFAPTWIRERERTLANWVPTAKSKAIAAQIIRKCDGLDGIVDGVINNYVACRALFESGNADGKPDPWAEIRCLNDRDPNPRDNSANACLTAAQIGTLRFIFSPYRYSTPLANGNTSFGMWLPTPSLAGGMGPPPGMAGPPGSAPGGSGPPGPGAPPPAQGGAMPRGAMPAGMMMGGFFTDTRYRGQEGAAPDAPVFASTGSLGLTGFLMGDPAANPLDYVEGETNIVRRQQLAAWFDSVNPDLSAFKKRGGKLIVAIGSADTLASPGSQLDYYQSVLELMGRPAVDSFARFYVLPQTGHGLTGTSYAMDGSGKSIAPAAIPSSFDRIALLRDWVEKGIAPAKSITVTGSTGTRPMCSYPEYPRYIGGDATQASGYRCTEPGTGSPG